MSGSDLSIRFLWWWWQNGDPRKPVVEGQLLHQVPGLADSGSNSCFAVREIGRRQAKTLSEPALATINKNFYVDDMCKSGDNLQATREVVQEVKRALAAGGFRLTKFVANDPRLLEGLHADDCKPREAPPPGRPAMDKALGIWWDTETDLLKINFPTPTQRPTRRGILSYIMSPFDPCGLALPYLLDMKLLVQRLFSAEGGWDAPVTGPDLDEWQKWVAELPNLPPVTCPRALIPRPDYTEIDLCVFADASERGYAATAYVVCQYPGRPSSRIGLGKVRVAPKKTRLTIPRLELLAAVAAVEVAAQVKESLDVEFDGVYFWTDSTTVLHWVNNPHLQLKAFVANRVAKVIEGSKGATWSHVSTHDNPADIGSRGLRPSQVAELGPWLNGPKWLTGKKEDWPLGQAPVRPKQADLEVKKINVADVRPVTPADPTPQPTPIERLFARHSTITGLKTSAAWLLRLRARLRRSNAESLARKGPLLAADLLDAETALVRTAQWAAYPALMAALTETAPGDKHLPAVSAIRNMRELSPFIDETGLLRVGGRLQRGPWSYEQTHPAILPRRHPITGLLVRDVHEAAHHRGYGHVLAQIRQRFWVIGGNGTVRHYLLDCIRCRHGRAQPGQQQMAPLPAHRLQIGSPAFTHTAVDYFGPIDVRVKRSTMKRYGCLMTCLTTRAVHLEIAHALTGESFLMAFRRFASTYPTVREMLSDNGTNFVRADKDLRKEFEEAIKLPEIARRLRDQKINFRWKFNPPAASHQGGVFERMIGLVRACLRNTMRDISYRTPNEEGLLTMMKGIEGVLNSRPLLPAGTDPESFDVLTPAQILRPGTPAMPPPSREFTSGDAIHTGYRSSQWHVDQFWRRFSANYVPMLQKRTKWHRPHRNFAVGDLVLIQDRNAPRYCWRLALVERTEANSVDGLVRKVHLRQAFGRPLTRDVRSICLLEAAGQ